MAGNVRVRRAAKIDANQPEIVKALREAGAAVTSLAAVGQGVCDLLVTFRGQTYLVEVKDGAKPPSQRQLTPDQIKWHGEQRTKVHVVHNVDQALAVIGAVRDVRSAGLDLV